ncbi:MAG: tRNA (adenosine(37)-N6)-threonylcarbamoyltransferase complex dimerization subunit type 1 TsaB [Desulfovibrionaceae bacterium]
MTSPVSSASAPRGGADADARDHLLALNGAEERLQIVLGRVDAPDAVRLAAVQEWVVPGRAMQLLTPSLDHMLRGLGLAPGRIGRIACVRGPGSFTGLRLVLASALGLAKALDAPLAGIDNLPLLAQSAAPLLPERARLWCVTHARRAQVYVQGFDVCRGGGQADARPLGPPRALMQEDAASAITTNTPAACGPPYLLGTGVRRNAAFFASALPQAVVLPDTADIPHTATLLAVAHAASYAAAPIVPLYLRGSDAEENLASIAAKQGIAPDEAKARLDALTAS